jgi:hypothetical protein
VFLFCNGFSLEYLLKNRVFIILIYLLSELAFSETNSSAKQLTTRTMNDDICIIGSKRLKVKLLLPVVPPFATCANHNYNRPTTFSFNQTGAFIFGKGLSLVSILCTNDLFSGEIHLLHQK